MTNDFLSAKGIYKSYPQGSSTLEILKGVDLSISKGEALCICGSSGAGKSTLLHILGALDRPNKGELCVNSENIFLKSDDELAKFRSLTMGFVFQFHHLLSEFTALENVMMPGRIAGDSVAKCKEKALTLLDHLGLSHRSHHHPSELSGGEQQRVAIARSLMNSPKLLFADEPTGNLDTYNTDIIQDLFFQLKEQFGLTLVVVTHDQNFAKKFTRVLNMKDGVWDQ